MELLAFLILAAIIGLVSFVGDVLKEVKWLRISVASISIVIIVAYVIKCIFFT